MTAGPTRLERRLLVVTADDFGIGVATSQGIVESAGRGPVTATSALVVAEAFEASLPLLTQSPHMEVGLHLALTGRFRPLVATPASGFVGRDGHFRDPGRLLLACLSRRVSSAALGDEIAAQVERFRRLTGRSPTHFDGHHHVHEWPVIRHVVARLATDEVLPRITRVTTESEGMRRRVPGDRAHRWILEGLGRKAREIFRAAGLATNDSMFGQLLLSRPAPGFPWAAHLAQLPAEGVVEWTVHPGRPDLSLRAIDSYVEGRVLEWQALTAPEHRALWEDLGWTRSGKSVLEVPPV
jgi:chitin disaccharide deacetylase